MYDDAPRFQRTDLARKIVIPQLMILTLFIVSRADVWLAITSKTLNLSSFFFDLVSAGAGWAMLSLSTLMASLLAYFGSTAQHFEQVLKADLFQSITARGFELELEAEKEKHHRLVWGACAALLMVVIIGGGSAIGAQAYPHDQVEANLPTWLAFILAVCVAFFAGVSYEIEYDVRAILVKVIGAGYQWDAEKFARMKSFYEATPESAAKVRAYLACEIESFKSRFRSPA